MLYIKMIDIQHSYNDVISNELLLFEPLCFLLCQCPDKLITKSLSHLFHIRQLAVIVYEPEAHILLAAFASLGKLCIRNILLEEDASHRMKPFLAAVFRREGYAVVWLCIHCKYL